MRHIRAAYILVARCVANDVRQIAVEAGRRVEFPFIWLVAKTANLIERTSVWHQRLIAAQHYHAQHRQGEERTPFLHWLDDYRGRVQHWIATHPIQQAALDDTADMILPDFDDPNFNLAHYQLSGGSAEYLRLKDAMLDAEIEAVFTRTETSPSRLPLRVVDYDDDMYLAVTP